MLDEIIQFYVAQELLDDEELQYLKGIQSNRNGIHEITSEDSFIDRPDSESIPRNILHSQDDSPAWNEELKIADEAARSYYENTVFEVVSLELKSQTENEISFSVCVSKGGIVQEPDRTIFLEFVNGHWEVVNEGY